MNVIVAVIICVLFPLNDAYYYRDAYKRQTLPTEIRKKAVENLIRRFIGEKANSFVVNIVGGDDDSESPRRDTFAIRKTDDDGGRVIIVANSGIAAAYAFHYYLKNYCDCHISWDADQLRVPAVLPAVDVNVTSYDELRYYQNVCAYSYSYAWWTWRRWERELDWMAVNGINVALAPTAQEAIWSRVYRAFNMTRHEIDEHFAGPAFLAWQRMGNVRGYGGPLSDQWHVRTVRLQHKILRRMRELGITPVLPAFCGVAPRAFARLFPDAKMTRLSKWCDLPIPDRYCCPYLLDPYDPLYRTVGDAFMRELTGEFGKTHLYNCDTFNENDAPYGDADHLRKTATATLDAMLSADPDATWLLQGWAFAFKAAFWTPARVESYLSGVPNDRMIVLDLQSEARPQYVRLRSYYGKRFVWCMLHNFGGTLGMHGSLAVLNERVSAARRMTNGTMIGTGVTPEGIHQNYVVYDFMLESGWRDETVDENAWVERYAERRYGVDDGNLKTAWRLLANSVYAYKDAKAIHGRYTFCIRPSLNITTEIWYDSNDVIHAWDLFVDAAVSGDVAANENYLHDLVDVSRQVLQILFDRFYAHVIEDVAKSDLNSFREHSSLMLELLQDLEMLLSTNARFMLGPWLEAAKSASGSHFESVLFEFHARLQITLWLLQKDSDVLDYATKQWAGVVQDYYEPRWRLFFEYVRESLIKSSRFDLEAYNERVFNLVEKRFVYDRKTYPLMPVNDTKLVAKILHAKWKRRIIGVENIAS